MKFWKGLLGLLTGGVSLLPDVIAKGAMKSGSGDKGSGVSDGFDALKGMLTDEQFEQFMNAVEAGNTNDIDAFLNKRNSNYGYSVSDGNAISDWIAGNTGSRLTTAEEQANAFNRSERIASEDFTHNEAVDARMWEQYVANNKYQWETDSMRNAGINPAMAYGGGSLVSTNATSAMGSSSPANSVAPHHSSIGDMIQSVMALVRMPLEIRSMKEDLRSKELGNDLKEKDLEWYDTEHSADLKIKEMSVDEIQKGMEEADSRISLNKWKERAEEQGIDESKARTAVEWAKYASIGLDNQLKEKLNPLLVRAQELQNQYQETENEFQRQRILAELAETRARTNALYAQAALDGARKAGVDLDNKKKTIESGYWHENARWRANGLKWQAEAAGENLKQERYQTKNAKYYSEHYEEAFRNSWSQSGVEWGVTESIGEAIGNAAALGFMLAF